jgi:hypothetical protein
MPPGFFELVGREECLVEGAAAKQRGVADPGEQRKYQVAEANYHARRFCNSRA